MNDCKLRGVWIGCHVNWKINCTATCYTRGLISNPYSDVNTESDEHIQYLHVCVYCFVLSSCFTLSLCLCSGMRILVTLLLDTLPMLGNVLLLCFFVFFIFGIVGVQLWNGLLRNRCFVEINFSLWVPLSLCRDILSVFVHPFQN